MYVYTIVVLSLLAVQSTAQNLVAITLDAKFPSGRTHHATVYDGHNSIYTWGGADYEWKREILKYNLSTATLQQIGTLKEGVIDFGSGVWIGNEKLLHYGGRNPNTSDGNSEIYNFNTADADGSWNIVSSLPRGCYYCTGVWDKGENTYIIGGARQSYTAMNTIFKYSNMTQQTEIVAQLPSPRHSTSAVLDNNTGDIYIFGGDTGLINFNDILRFDPRAGSVTKVGAVLPVPVANTCTVWTGKEAYIIGGSAIEAGSIPHLVRFNPSTNEVVSLFVTNFPNNIHRTGCVFVEKFNRIFILGGWDPIGMYRDEFMYIDLDPSSASTTDTPTTTHTISSEKPEPQTSTHIPIDNDSSTEVGIYPDPTNVRVCHWKKCTGWDEFGREWEGRPDKIVSQNCPRAESGYSAWECLPNGQFEGDSPNFLNCTTKWLDELVGNRTEDVLPILRRNTYEAKHSKKLEWKFYGHEIQKILEIVLDIIKTIEFAEPQAFSVYVDHALAICWNVLTNHAIWNQVESGSRPPVGLSILRTMESCLFELSSRKHNSGEASITPEVFQYEEYIAMTGILLSSGRGVGESETQHIVSFPQNCKLASKESCIVLTLDVGENDIIYAAMKIKLGFAPSALPGSSNTLGPYGYPLKDKVLNGPLLTFSTVEYLGDKNGTVIEIKTPSDNVTITFRHHMETSGSRNYNVTRKLHNGENAQAVHDNSVCVFLDERNLLWSAEGCELVRTTRLTSTCRCDHLTYFALLMDMHKYNEKDYPLEILTIVLGGISILCLIICVIVFATDTSKDGQSPRMFIVKHLCVCLILANACMLLLVDRNYFALSEGVCTAVAVMTQYIFLTAFIWMGIEGFYLFRNVVLVFDVTADSKTLWKFRLVAFGLPILIIGLTTVIGLLKGDHVFGGINHCWLEGYYIWSFLAPVAVILVGNIVSVFLAIRAACKSQKNLLRSQRNAQVFRFRIRGFLGLTITLGLSWIFGFFLLIQDSVASIVIAYIFCILIGSQGIFIAIFYVMLNRRIQESLKGKMKWPDFTHTARNFADKIEIRNKIPRPSANRTGHEHTFETGIIHAGVKRRNLASVGDHGTGFGTNVNIQVVDNSAYEYIPFSY